MIRCDYLVRMEKCLGRENFVYDLPNKRWHTYAQIWKNAQNYAIAFREMSLTEVAVILENGIYLFTIYFACMLGNIKVIPVDPQKAKAEIDHILAHHPGIMVIRNSEQLPQWTDEEADVEEIRTLLKQTDFNKPYMITYTSGSTGQAKGVIHSLDNLFGASVAFGEMLGYGKNSRVCHTMPMTYMAGILNTILMPFIMGSSVVLFPRFSVMTAVSFWRNIRNCQVNTFWLSPTMLNILMTVDRKGDIAEYLESIDTTFCIGTAPLFPQVKEKFESRYRVKLLPSYGLSETLFISSKTYECFEGEEAVGEILPSVDLRFAPDGEIQIDVPWMFLGYSNEPTENYFRDGYYLSGDLGQMKEGQLYITGRKKDLIIRGGMNISPKQIEDVLMKSGEVAECAVAAIVEENEEHILCWYVPANEADNNSVYNRIVMQELGMAYRVDEFIRVKEIPKNLNGKIDKEKLRRAYGNDR